MPEKSVLKHSEIVFMYSGDDAAYKAYGTTFVGWGGAEKPEEVIRHRQRRIHCTGSMWCLTAGARELHGSADLRDAVAVDFLGEPVMPPWQFDHVYKGQKAYFGCTNHPTFRALCRQRVISAMSGHADGLHVDDHAGTGGAAMHGGGFCDHCMIAFRGYLRTHAKRADLESAGMTRGDLPEFDYRTLVRKYARDREEYLRIHHRIPLDRLFLRFQFQAAAAHVRELGKAGSEAAGHPITLSANACVTFPWQDIVLGSITHAICEIQHDPHQGPSGVAKANKAYGLFTRRGVPAAVTAFGHDWAWVKARGGCHDLVRYWIANTYARGQRFMCPHPQRQWCFDEKQGTHWYAAPVEEYAPVYTFIRKHAAFFDGLEEVRPAGVRGPRNIRHTVRRKGEKGRTVLHVLNGDYDLQAMKTTPRKNVRLRVPKKLLAKGKKRVRLIRWDGPEQTAPVSYARGVGTIVIPLLTNWTLVVLK